MSKVVIFVGPTIPVNECKKILQATYLEPAARGDIYRATQAGAIIIGLIDGYFGQRCSPWHKELLYALYNGVRVYGCSSIGALRAAELSEFGMIGVGSIYDDFRSRKLTRDDEVTVIHAPQELAFAPLSEALVNLRATIEELAKRDLVSAADGERILTAASRLFYQERTIDQILSRAFPGHAAVAERELYIDLFQRFWIDQKKLDAVNMLKFIGSQENSKIEDCNSPNFEFSETDYWRLFKSSIDADFTSEG